MGYLKPEPKFSLLQDFAYYATKFLILEPTAILLAIFALLVAIIFLVLFIPIFIYRFMLGKTFKFFRPDLDKFLRCGQALFASYEKFYKKPQNNIVGVVKLKGKIGPDVQEFRKLVEKVLRLRLPNGNLKYPELKQYPFKWMGYLFWKDDAEFDITNHVYYYSDPNERKVYTDTEVAEIETKLQTQSFTRNRSLWNIIILPNAESAECDPTEKYFIIYIVMNHCYGDGYGMAKVIFVDLAGYKLESLPQPKFDTTQRNFFQKLLFLFGTIIFCTYDFFRPAVVGNVMNVWNVAPWKMKETHVSSKPLIVPIQFLKDIRHKHKTYLPSVIIAGWVGALRKSGSITGIGTFDRKTTVTVPVPMPNHPDHLDIHASVLNMQFPIGIEDPVERLKAIDKYLQDQKKSKALAVVLALKPICGLLFPDMIGYLYPLIPTAAVFNIFPGPEYIVTILEYEVTSVHFTFGQTKARFSTLLSSLTYNKHIALKTTVNTAIFKTSAEIDQFNSFIQEEFELLANTKQNYTHLLTQGKAMKTNVQVPV